MRFQSLRRLALKVTILQAFNKPIYIYFMSLINFSLYFFSFLCAALPCRWHGELTIKQVF